MEKTIIAMFCCKRADKLKASVEALLKNPECASMEIIFFCDGHKNAADKPGVLRTRAYVDSITGFKRVHTHFREKNVGTGINFQTGFAYLCENYEQFIVVEDDLVVTTNYIRYMLDALAFYKEQKSVFCVTGYCFPLEKWAYPYDAIVHNRFCSYGWASWSDRVKNVTWDKKELSRLMKGSPGFKSRLNKEGLDLYRMLKKQINGKISTWDIQMQVHVAENRLKVIYPVSSKVCNIGFDDESTHTYGINYLKTPQDSGKKRSFHFCNVDLIEPALQKQLKKPYGLRALATRKIINTVLRFIVQVKKRVRSIGCVT